ncbi:hypothetical protein FOZ62_019516 [Perkinsus olseni]|uniref:dUTP diphosphatase n=1 Tax=Perkinsus olseni TaxID=32597 RepID=A0A7J6RZB4_PEROL|nr:hypothetical protein FOZ62_019516 [Perkinsus olseni]
MHLKILPLDSKAAEYYSSHKTFHAGDSGLDLFVVKEQTIQPGETAFIKLGIKAAASDGKDGTGLSWLLMARSSISKTPLRLSNSIGLIDQGYRGEIIAAVDNIKNEAYTVKEGDRLVQAVGFDGKGITMEIVEELDETTRGEGGFGSTDQKPSKTVEKQVSLGFASRVCRGRTPLLSDRRWLVRWRVQRGGRSGPEAACHPWTDEWSLVMHANKFHTSVVVAFVKATGSSVARFLSMLRMLCDMCEVQSDKGYRTRNYHKLLDPRPNFDPKGFPVAVVRAARGIQDEPSLCYNGKRYQFSDEVKEKAESFLKDIDREMILIAGYIEPALKSDFGQGLRTFKVELTDKLMEFDEMFVEFEQARIEREEAEQGKVWYGLSDGDVCRARLTAAEEREDIEQKQAEEAAFVRAVEAFLVLYSEAMEAKYTAGEVTQAEVNVYREFAESIPERSLELAEAAIFYEYKVIDLGREDWLESANEFIRSYLELRLYVAAIPLQRLSPEYIDNKRFITLLRAFHRRGAEAFPVLEYVSRKELSTIVVMKRFDWQALLLPELQQLYQRKLEKGHAA